MLKCYEEFTMLNNNIVRYLNELITNNFQEHSDGEIRSRISLFLEKMEEIKYKTDDAIVGNFEIDKVNNLRYSIMNSLFLLSDLLHFYDIKEFERFKMRIVNYINHISKPQAFR